MIEGSEPVKIQGESRRLILVSYRSPFIFKRKVGGGVRVETSIGGVSRSLINIYKMKDTVWVASNTVKSDYFKDKREIVKINYDAYDYNLKFVYLSENDVKNFYGGFVNKILWPIAHNFLEKADYRKEYWRYYVKVNNRFAEMVASIYNQGDRVWLHDYQLSLTPRMIMERGVNRKIIGFFWHIPWPPYEIFRTLPWCEDVLKGLIKAKLIGFHCKNYVENFLKCCSEIVDYKVDWDKSRVFHEDGFTQVESIPLGVDTVQIKKLSSSREVENKTKKIVKTIGNKKIILSAGRLDYTKGIIETLTSFKMLLQEHPEYRRQIMLILVTSPSRENVKDYIRLRKEASRLVGEINSEYQTIDWIPIRYFYQKIPTNQLYALYKIANIMLVTPLIDGMNLVCKEYIAANDSEGVLIISKFTGAAAQLKAALQVNPYDPEDIMNKLVIGLEMPAEERVKRLKILKEKVEKENFQWWIKTFFERWEKSILE